MNDSAGKILFVIAALTLAMVLIIASQAPAGDCNGPGDDCGFECTEGGQPVTVETVCQTVVTNNAEAYCQSYAGSYCEANADAYCDSFCLAGAQSYCGQICAIAEDICVNENLAYQVAVTQTACVNANRNSQFALQYCGDTSQTCGDAAQACTQAVSVECPVCPDVTVEANILRCKTVKTLKSGAIRGKDCFLVTEAS